MRKSILLAMLMVCLMAIPAFASVQNIKISGGVDSFYAFRDNWDFGVSSDADIMQNLFFTLTTLQVDADLTDNVTATIAIVNERAWGMDVDSTTAGTETDIELDLAFVTLREMLYSPLTIVAGRQRLPTYGNGLVIAKGTGSGNSALSLVADDYRGVKAMDAVRAILDYDPLTIEIVYGKVDSNTNQFAAEDRDDVDLYGIQTAYELGDDLNTVVEAYFWAKIDKQVAYDTQLSPAAGIKPDTVYTPGIRASTTPIEGLTVSGEIAIQRGNHVCDTISVANNQKRHAMAAEFMASYQVPVAEDYNPIVSYDYIYASGDSNPDDSPSSGEVSRNEWTAWDDMYEGISGGKIYSALFTLTNVHIHSISIQANPMEDVTSKFTFSKYWLDKESDGTTTAGTGVFDTMPDGSATPSYVLKNDEKDLGYAVDFETTYDYTEDVSIGAVLSWFVPGDMFEDVNKNTASQILLDCNVDF